MKNYFGSDRDDLIIIDRIRIYHNTIGITIDNIVIHLFIINILIRTKLSDSFETYTFDNRFGLHENLNWNIENICSKIKKKRTTSNVTHFSTFERDKSG